MDALNATTTWNDINDAINGSASTRDGWYHDFETGSTERNIGQATLLGDILTFTTYVPSADACTFGGASYLYALHYLTGTPYFESVIGTVEGDLHDIGKNLVSMMLQGAGFKVVDLGTNITAQQFVDAVKEHNPQVIGMSALLTTTMPKMEETIAALKEAGIRDQVKIMAGGAPVTQDFVEKIGADAYGANAASAVDKAKELVA